MIRNFVNKIRQKKIKSNSLKRIIEFTDLMTNRNKTLYPELIDLPNGNNFLILTPHADDETFGCGGTLLKAVEKGKNIQVVLFSDNRQSIPDLDTNKTVKLRSDEFRKVMSTIGIQDSVELRLSPSNYVISDFNIIELAKIINKFRPDILFLPSPFDNHEDHKILNEIFIRSIQNIKFEFEIFFYEVWTPVLPNVEIEITNYIDRKKELIKIYESQKNYIQYEDSIIGLNKYRGLNNLLGKGYCESFFRIQSGELIKIYKKIFR